ncbi:SURF1 family cytochrome oxidase biogenesis protein [Agromyces aerolatus]|uniref:SURF1 family cytochrome oxidase biogenesis protein n=1 Tax=Agromyces sp. LY-1074 TaxID=3074080 RepID=UPI00285DB531|nr:MULTISPECIES: SURF1 family protein [unclassified Agromyces]MDR5700059.1 SURF1 family protein [Agromyces sp. LY-1074]MDR5706573.1 SURF1 family protein [Agromyces sp. LY-1358]
MSRWSFLRSRRWAGYLALVIVFAIACSALGSWQLNRRAEALTEVARIDANYDADPIPVAEALPDPAAFDPDARWRVVALTGEFLADDEVVIRNRPFQGTSGFEVVTPFRLDDGTVFFVDRGWIAQAPDGRPSEYAAPPSGQVEVTARLKAGEGTIAGRTASGRELATIDLDELAERVGEPSHTGAYGVQVQDATDAREPPMAAARPVRDEGPHLSYALQWYVFALMAFIGLAWAANQERKALAEASASPEERARAAKPKRVPKERTDADIEDAILDERQLDRR